MKQNPLLGREPFQLGLMNPNPKFKPATKTLGPRYCVEFEIDQESWDCFNDVHDKLPGMVIGAHCIVGDGGTTVPEKKKNPCGEFARMLKLDGFFRREVVWQAIGKDEHYLKWITFQPSAHSGQFSEEYQGEMRNPACHYRKVANGSGTGIKPKYSAIPLTDAEHKIQHNPGLNYEGELTDDDWWAKQRMDYVQQWAWERLKEHLEIDSMADEGSEQKVRAWAKEYGVDEYLPK